MLLLKSQLRRANALGARLALIVGDNEIAGGFVEVKDLAARTQAKVPRAEVVGYAAAQIALPAPLPPPPGAPA